MLMRTRRIKTAFFFDGVLLFWPLHIYDLEEKRYREQMMASIINTN